jgi:hypothetical protein
VDSDAVGETDFIDAIREDISVTDESRQKKQVIGSHRQDLPIEVLSFDLDGSEESLKDLPHRTIQLVEATKIDRHFATGLICGYRCRFWRKELDDRHTVVAGKTVKSGNGQAALATLVSAQNGGLELPFGCALHILE